MLPCGQIKENNMLGLPQKTELSKQLPKKAIYAKFLMNTAQKDRFDADISKITIVNEVSENTTIIPVGETVKSFYVLLISLKTRDYDERNIISLSKLIPQNMLMVLEFEDKCRLAVYRTKLLQSAWKKTAECTVQLSGTNLDAVWENIVTQVGDITVEEGNSLNEQIAANDERAKLEKEIAKLEKLARAEKQPKKKFELAQKVKALKEALK